jgi:hypothetical protein
VLGLVSLTPILTGCTVWLQRRQETISWQQESVLDERLVGSPETVVTPHADGWGWTLTVHEQVEQTIARRGTKSWIGRPAYVAPGLSWGIAAVGCTELPFAVLGVTMNRGQEPLPNGIKPTNRITERCLYPLIGLWPWPGEHLRESFESVVERARRERTWGPVGQAEVGIRFPGQEWWQFPVEPDGRMSLRLDRLPLDRDLPPHGQVELAVWGRGKPIK